MYIEIDVRNPRTHIENRKAQFTDYEISIQTNMPHFPRKQSKVRRRYSEFVWLKEKLETNNVNLKPLPALPENAMFGRFKITFIMKRMRGLQHFLQHVVEDELLLGDSYLHLFLQTDLPVRNMDQCIEEQSKRSIKQLILDLQQSKVKTEKEEVTESDEVLKSLECVRRSSLYTRSRSLSDARPFPRRKRANTLPTPPCGALMTSVIPEDDFLTRSWHGETDVIDELLEEEYEVIPGELTCEDHHGMSTMISLTSLACSSENMPNVT